MTYPQEPPMTKPAEHAATVSSKGQVVIPSDVRRKLGLSQGSVLRFVVDDSVRLLAAGGDIRKLKGRLAVPARPVSIDDMNDTIAQRRRRSGSA
jgi:AbrB family looped-hinge helix DNA binding protein